MSIKLDKNIILNFEKSSKIKIYFYDAWCSWIKLDIIDTFKLDDNLLKLDLWYTFDIYIEKKDSDKLENCNITRVVKSDHTWKEKVRYIFSTEKVKDRCGCWSSFSFDKKEIKIDLNKLGDMKKRFL